MRALLVVRQCLDILNLQPLLPCEQPLRFLPLVFEETVASCAIE
jgi:hypothetical protein